MTIHKEGKKILLVALTALMLIVAASLQFLEGYKILQLTIIGVATIFFLTILQFFRSPNRTIEKDDNVVLAPADGKVVVIENTTEGEYFKDERIQVSIFMSPINVHNNRNPVSGIVKYFKYHPGKYLVAWHPKSSTENERTTCVVQKPNGVEVLFRQIAGAMAKRICWYVKEGDKAEQGEEFGFIKFGSRVDVFLPMGTEILVEMNQKSVGGKTALARFN